MAMLGCATTGKLEKRMQERVGQNVNSVINEIGPPTQSFKKPDGDTVYTWHNTSGDTSRLINSWGQTQVLTESNYCDVSYTAGPDGIIKGWFHRGNRCIAR